MDQIRIPKILMTTVYFSKLNILYYLRDAKVLCVVHKLLHLVLNLFHLGHGANNHVHGDRVIHHRLKHKLVSCSGAQSEHIYTPVELLLKPQAQLTNDRSQVFPFRKFV